MLKNRDIIVFGDDWGRHPSTMQFIGKVLSRYNRVFWIGSIGMRKPKFSIRDFKRVIEKISSIFKKQEVTNTAVTVLNQFVIPFHDSGVARLINKYFIRKKIDSAVKKYNIKNFILLTSTPIISSIVGTFGERSSFYFCLDDYIFFEGTYKIIKQTENEIIKKADAVFYFSKKIFNARPGYSKSFLFSQGVNLDVFSKSTVSKPEIFRNKKKPVIGFWGLIDERFDIELFNYCANRLKDYNFVLIGDSKVNIRNNFPENVKMTGTVSYGLLPDFAGSMDAAIIPYKINELTSAINPLKLLEYFAAGLPVISTALPEVYNYKEFVYISADKEEFAGNIELALKENNSNLINDRKKIAEQFSWESITERISRIIINSEETKSGTNSV